MITLILYCIVCILYQIGGAICSYKYEGTIYVLSIIFAPIITPIEIAHIMYFIARK